jgi:hypothetical membrane protein
MSHSVPIRRLLRHPVANSESLESSALLVGAVAFVLAAIAAAIAFWGRDLPIAGPGSIGQFVALGAAVITIPVFMAARALRDADARDGGRARRPDVPGVRPHWYDIGALALAHAVIALLGWLGIASLLDRSFTGAVVFTFPAIMLAAVAIAVTAYAIFLTAMSLTLMRLSVTLVVFLAVGTLASMLSATDPLWWQKNLSTLGVSDDISALAFNLTLIIAGVIVTTIAHFATAGIPAGTPKEVRGRNVVRGGLVLIGVLLACVGIFPVDRFLAIHNLSATGMVIVYVVLVIGLRRFIPAMPRVFVLLGYVFVGVIVVLAVLFATGYYNLTAVELVAFLLVFSWLVVFLRNTSGMVQQRAESSAAASTAQPPTEVGPGVLGAR